MNGTTNEKTDEQRDVIDTILGRMRSIAVVGISEKSDRASNEVAGYLLRQGFSVWPVNPLVDSVFGLPCHSALGNVPEPVDVVDIFRRSSEAGTVVDEAIAIGAKAVWLQEGIVDHGAAERARRSGLLVVMDRCILKEHARWVAAAAGFP